MLIKNGLIVSPGNQLEQPADLRIRNGIIETIAAANSLTAEPDEQVLDASSLVIAPGLIDIHVHFRDPGLTYKEDLHTGAMAAAAGGYTTVICMANTKPVVDTPETLTDILTRAKEEKIHILQCASISRGMKGQELTDFHALRDSGACGFTDDGIPLLDESLVQSAMLQAKTLNVPLSFHEEDPFFIEKSGTTPDSAVVSKVFDEMQKGDIQIIESSDSEKYYIVLKMDVLETDEYFLSAKDSLLYEMKSEDFDALITQWTEAQNVVKNQDAYKRYDPKKLFDQN